MSHQQQTCLWVCTLLLYTAHLAQADTRHPNVLFIAIDDLNDWIGCLGGNAQARSPNIDSLAKSGTNFTRAYCQAPICNPSRASLMTGRLPSSTGLYYLAPLIRDCGSTRNLVTLPQHFAANGYETLAAGKLFHENDSAEFETYGGSFGDYGPRLDTPLSDNRTHPLWDWGPLPERDEDMPDAKIANWAVEQLRKPHKSPFFLGVGFYRPHVPLYAPEKWFAEFPIEEIRLPATDINDLDDVPQYGRDLSWSKMAPRHQWILDHDQWASVVQSYLASIYFVDAQVGKVLAALKRSEHADDTIVILWSDHGFHLGTKQRWGKRSLWGNATRVVMLASGPGITVGQECERPVGLIDLYPTLIELCGLPPRENLEGHSLVPQLKDAAAPRPWPALTSFGQNNHSVRTSNWRYIQYTDGTEELYATSTDPNEIHNLSGNSQYAPVIASLRKHLPSVNRPMAPGSAHADARPGSKADID